MATTQADDDQAVSAVEEEDGEAEATTATTTRLLPTLLHLSPHRLTVILAPHPGGQVSSLVQRLVRQPATPWEAATIAVLPPVKLDRQTGLEEEEAARKLSHRGHLGEEADLRVRLPILHHLVVAGRDMNQPGSAGVAGDSW